MKHAHIGFTLIELMAVVAIVGILAAVAYPSYRESIRKAKRAEGRSALMRLMQQEERFFSQNNSYIAFSSLSTDEQEKKFRWHSGNNPETSAYEIRAEACKGESLQNCVTLIAIPGTDKVDGRFQDPVCGSLSFDSRGNAGPVKPECWR